MAQDTRKDPRAKVLSMTVRYKSATVDEFIEHHSHDVSRGGIFIKTPSPFPPGTLLKFEIRIADEQAVLAGVGRVVWKREKDHGSADQPGGMGVKFIKIDDKSKGLIARLVDAQRGGVSSFDAGKPAETEEQPEAKTVILNSNQIAAAAGIAPEEAAAAPAAAAAKSAAKRSSTMLGLGAIGSSKAAEKSESETLAARSEPKNGGGAFFPSYEDELPPPEERTVMKQAAELLQQALAEAGGSMEEIGAPVKKAPEPSRAREPRPIDRDVNGAGSDAADEARKAKPVSQSNRPAPIIAAPVAPAPAEEGGGSGKILMFLLVAAGIGTGAYFFLHSDSNPQNQDLGTSAPLAPPRPAPTHTTEPTQAAVPTVVPPPTASAAPTASASASASASAKATAAPKETAAPKPPPPPPRETAAVAPPPKPPPPKPPGTRPKVDVGYE